MDETDAVQIGAATRSRARYLLFRALRVVLALALVAFVVSQVHWRDYPVTDEAGRIVTSPGILSCVGRVDPWWMSAAVVVSIVSLFVAALRWRLLLAIQDVHLSIARTIKLQFMGEFFNTVIPGMVGGDVVKACCATRNETRKAHVFVSVFVDRLLGLCAMVCTTVVMLVVLCVNGPPEAGLLRISAPSVGLVLVGTCAGLAFLLSARLRRVCGLQRLYARVALATHIADAGDAVRRYGKKPSVLARAFLISLLAQGLGSAFVVLLGMAIGLDASWMHYFLHVPLITIISAVPITPGGIGVMEELYLLFFAAAGNPSQVLALAVLVRATTLLSVLPGGLVAAFSGDLSAAGALPRR